LSLGLLTGAEITIGPKPTAAPPKPFPQLQTNAAFDKTFHIQLAANIFFADLVTALKSALIDQTFGEDKKITIRNFSLKGEGGRLVINLTSTGDFDGELTLLAKPVYNARDNSLTFENVDFETKNAGFLITVGSWLFSNPIRGIIKKNLDAAVVEQIEKARLNASAALSSISVTEQIKLKGEVKSLSLGDATVLNDRLTLQIMALGELRVNVK
jgi:hypothetical protein